MQKTIIIDTGPIVAFLNSNDQYHEWAKNQFSYINTPLITCESVISEACYLLRKYPNGSENILKLLERHLIIISFDLQSEITEVEKLMVKYNNVPMSLADACLVRLSEQVSNSVICTLDTDFRIYRKNKRNIIPLIIPKELR